MVKWEQKFDWFEGDYMKKIKIVHTGDLHFDTPFKDVGESQSRINKEELKEVFRNIIYFCKEKAVWTIFIFFI